MSNIEEKSILCSMCESQDCKTCWYNLVARENKNIKEYKSNFIQSNGTWVKRKDDSKC